MSPRRRDYQRLDAGAVGATVVRLRQRIAARFPERSLVQIADQLADVVERVSRESTERAPRERPVVVLSRLAAVVIALIAGTAVGLAITDALSAGDPIPAVEWLQVLESGINDMVFAGIATYFLLSVPGRIRRGRLLAILYRLRSLAHVIDMHQLTKDPERLMSSPPVTGASVEPDLDSAGLGRYLDYCSELLSLVGKAAALCAEETDDAVVLDTVSEIEELTNGMSRKIWQKISVLHAGT